jgi:hypothetical protein
VIVIAIPPVGAWHVIGDSGRPMRAQAAAMAGNPFAAMKDLDSRGGDARLDLLAEQLVRDAVGNILCSRAVLDHAELAMELIGMACGLASEIAPQNIRVNVVSPGSIDTRRDNPEWY